MNKYLCELLGTFWLVLGGCGTAVFACGVPAVGVGYFGVALAFGLTVLTMAYAIGPISGCHLNPAVTCGCAVAGRMPIKDVVPYIIAQVVGAIAAAWVLSVIVSGNSDAEWVKTTMTGFACNGYGEHSPSGFNMQSALITEVVLTFVFLMVILGSTAKNAAAGFAGLAIGLCLTLIHLISIPITNTSVNPARSISQAIFANNDWAMGQLWLFIVAPIVGAVIAAIVWKVIGSDAQTEENI